MLPNDSSWNILNDRMLDVIDVYAMCFILCPKLLSGLSKKKRRKHSNVTMENTFFMYVFIKDSYITALHIAHGKLPWMNSNVLRRLETDTSCLLTHGRGEPFPPYTSLTAYISPSMRPALSSGMQSHTHHELIPARNGSLVAMQGSARGSNVRYYPT
jgi:hypothetical protein